MAEFVASGRMVDFVLALVALQAFGLWLFRRVTGRGPGFADVAWFLAAGAALLVALRVALAGGWWGWIVAALMAALVAQVMDLARRWRG